MSPYVVRETPASGEGAVSFRERGEMLPRILMALCGTPSKGVMAMLSALR